MAKAKKRIRFRPILVSMLYWVAALTIFGFIRLYGLDKEGLYTLTQPQIPLLMIIIFQGVGMGLVIGAIYGLLDQVLRLDQLRELTYGWIVLIRTGIHLLVIPILVFVAIFVSFFFFFEAPLAAIWQTLNKAILQPTVLLVFIYTAIFSFIYNAFRQIAEMFGPGLLLKIMLGRYHQPKEEERVFMFLDLRSSTEYGEKLGHVLYSQLLQDCFVDLTEAVSEHQAEIYQYVGDEVVLTWTMEAGLEKANCLWAYYTFMASIEKRSRYYFEKYDIIPAFKAGVNLGKVMVAEVGIIKKEIAFHSDVLNTAARIQGQCNALGKSLLVSPELVRAIEDWNGLSFAEVGSVSLKGKAKKMLLYSVEKAQEQASELSVPR
ncbi:MAG: adenylate/guanylate cyclase domain-containing protein [Bacteroidota bacterium]